MKAEEARAICERLGLLERIAEDVAAAPPASPELIERLRRIFASNAEPPRDRGAANACSPTPISERETG